MSNLAINDAGEVLAYDGKEWKPAPLAQNDKGAKMAYDGKEWRSLDSKAAPASTMDAVKATAGSVADKVNTGVNWAGTQFTKGITGLLGAPDMLGKLGEFGAQYLGEKVGAPEMGKNVGGTFRGMMTAGGLMPSAETMNNAVFKDLGVPEVNAAGRDALTLTNPFGMEGKVDLGKMLDAGAQAVPGAMMLPAGAAAQTLSGPARAMTTAVPAMAGGVASEAAGQATEGTPYEIPARILGGGAGYLAGGKLVSPLPANLTANEARAVQIAKDQGVPLSVGQETGRGKGIERALARFPTSAGQFDDLASRQSSAVNRAALKQGGFDGDRVDPETIKAFNRQAGGDFDKAVQGIQKVELQPDFYNKSGAAIAKYTENTPPSDILKGVSQKLDDFFDPKLMKGGSFPELDGRQFQEFRRGLSTSVDDLYKNGQSGAAKALQAVRGALDDAAQASLPAGEKAAMDSARKNYAVYKLIEKAAGAGTVASRSSGDLAPSALTQQLRRRQGDAFSRTTGGMNDVASVSQYLADTFPNSGTPTIQAMQGLLSGGAGLGAAGMMGAGAAGIMNPAIAVPAAAAAVTPNLMARAMTGNGTVSRIFRDYLANQAMPTARGQIPQGIERLPFSLAPGVAVSAPRLENRQ